MQRIKEISFVLNFLSAACALAAAYFWAKTAWVPVPTRSLTFTDFEDMNWIAEPLSKQARLNGIAAKLAACAAALQGVVAVLALFGA